MFVAQALMHRQRLKWEDVTHVRLKLNAPADTQAGGRILEHIRRSVDQNGIAEIAALAEGFPSVRSHKTKLGAMRADLRHMANARRSGIMEENKGLLELGSLFRKWSSVKFQVGCWA